VLTNNVALVCAAVTVVYLIVVTVGFEWTATSTHNVYIVFFFLYFTVVVLNKYKYHHLASVLVSILPVLLCMVLSLFDKLYNIQGIIPVNEYYSYRFILLVCSLIPIAIFRLKDILWLGIGLLPGLLSMAFFDPLHNALGIGFSTTGIDEPSYFIVTATTIVAYLSIVAIALLSKVYTEGLEKDKEALLQEREASNQSLRQRNHELEGLHKQVKADSEKLNAMNLKLEERVADRTEELSQVIADLEQRNTELERFTYTVSHDLKSPLVTIRGFLGFVEKDLEKGNYTKLRGSLQHIQGASDTMMALIEDLLDLMRVGHVANPAEVCSIADLMVQVRQRLAIQIKQANVLVEVQSDMPEVFVDPKRIVELLQNLVENAIKFRGSQAQPQVNVGNTVIDGRTVFYVQDNGVGIPELYQSKVFDLFERLDAEVEGTGVGLAIVKRIVELHHGSIWVQSFGKNMGTTFYFTLPMPNNTLKLAK